jgi:hypothetical protein
MEAQKKVLLPQFFYRVIAIAFGIGGGILLLHSSKTYQDAIEYKNRWSDKK